MITAKGLSADRHIFLEATYRIRFLPRMFGVEARVGIGMFELGVRNLNSEPLQKTLPGPTAPLTPPPKLVKP